MSVELEEICDSLHAESISKSRLILIINSNGIVVAYWQAANKVHKCLYVYLFV